MLLYHIQVSYLLLCICIGIQSHITDSDKEAFCDAYILLYREIVTGQTVILVGDAMLLLKDGLCHLKREKSLDEGMHISLYSYKCYSTNAQKLRNANNQWVFHHLLCGTFMACHDDLLTCH